VCERTHPRGRFDAISHCGADMGVDAYACTYADADADADAYVAARIHADALDSQFMQVSSHVVPCLPRVRQLALAARPQPTFTLLPRLAKRPCHASGDVVKRDGSLAPGVVAGAEHVVACVVTAQRVSATALTETAKACDEHVAPSATSAAQERAQACVAG